MAVENPPLNRIHVLGYTANDRNYPIVSLVADPRVAGYRVPEDLSVCPDKRYPNHVFTGAQPLSGDERVRHTWEILPSPYVPFTRYDDDLGPVQGRRRFVVNSGQAASLERDKKVSYEAREGSAIVSSEIEETWDGGSTDPDLESPFPIKDRDFYDPSRGAVQERRQLISTTGDEVATLENNNGVITQTSYEAYNEYLSFKVVQTYSVDGPQLVGFATNNEGQLTTVTTQRKGSQNYTPPDPTATKTVEANREDAESIVERIVDAPRVFPASSFSVERPDPIPQKFRVAIPTKTSEFSLQGTAQSTSLLSNELSKSEQQVTEFVKRARVISRTPPAKTTLTGSQYTTDLGGGIATVTEEYPFKGTVQSIEFGVVSDEVEDLGDGNKIRKQIKLPKKQFDLKEFDDGGNPIFAETMAVLKGQDYDEELDIVIPYSQVVAEPTTTKITEGERRRVTPRDLSHSLVQKYDVEDAQDLLDEYYWEIPDMIAVKLPNKLLSARAVTSRSASSGEGEGIGDTFTWSYSKSESIRGSVIYDIEEGFDGNIPTVRSIFFLPKGSSSPDEVLNRLKIERGNANLKFWPNARPQSHELVVLGQTVSIEESESVSFDSSSTSKSNSGSISVDTTLIPPTIHGEIEIYQDGNLDGTAQDAEKPSVLVSPNVLPRTEPYSVFPTGEFIYQINASPYKFSYTRIDVLLVKITSDYV
jgi:hypothetical protein